MKKGKPKSKLRYLPDAVPGFRRIKRGRGYYYTDKQGNRVTDTRKLERFQILAIPPAWKEVWISPSKQGHLQATGVDEEGRKQYLYHPAWTKERQRKKLHRMVAFGDVLPRVRRQIARDARHQLLIKEKVVAIALKTMEETLIRVGNEQYLHKYSSYGLTTLKKKHATISKGTVVFRFSGKKGVKQEVVVDNPYLIRELLEINELPGPFLFQYVDKEGKRCRLRAAHINTYLKTHTTLDFSSKDYRTWHAGLWAFRLFAKHADKVDEKGCKETILKVLDDVSQRLGNTRAVCKQYYVPDSLISAYEDGSLLPFLHKSLDGASIPPAKKAERQLLAFLRWITKKV